MAIGCPYTSLLSLGTFWTGSMAPPFQRYAVKFTRNEHIAHSSIIFPDKFTLISVLFKRFQPQFPRLSQGCGIWAKSWWLHRKSTYLGACTWDVLENWQKHPQHSDEVSTSRNSGFPLNICRSEKTFYRLGVLVLQSDMTVPISNIRCKSNVGSGECSRVALTRLKYWVA